MVRPPHGLDEPFTIFGHDNRLGQVVRNLIDNAISFSPAGSTVTVRLRRLARQVEFRVDDEGPGINADQMDRIFERFYTDRPEGYFGKNSGLGLSISRQIVEAHGGKITAANRHGAASGDSPPPVLGARFTVRIPAFEGSRDTPSEE